MQYLFPRRATTWRVPMTKIRDTDLNLPGVIIKLEDSIRLWVFWSGGDTTVQLILPYTDMATFHQVMPYVDVKKGTINGQPLPDHVTGYLFDIREEFIRQHNALINLLAESKKITSGTVYRDEITYSEPDAINTYILIDNKHVYRSDPRNTSFRLWEESCVYERNGQTFEVIDNDHKRFRELKIPSNIKTITLD